MKKRYPCFFISREEFARTYLYLNDILNVYEDESNMFNKTQEKLCRLYEEEHNAVLDMTTAQAIVAEGQNPRGAGRKRTITTEMKDEIRLLRKKGDSVKDLASRFNISRRSVYLACQ